MGDIMDSTYTFDAVWYDANPFSTVQFTATARWWSADPLVIVLEYPSSSDDETPRPWIVGRDLFADCFAAGKAGDGDVLLELSGDWLFVHLSSPFGDARLKTPLPGFMTFITETYRVIGRGDEDVATSLDRELENVLRDFGPGDTLI
jgi:hypothetical protein